MHIFFEAIDREAALRPAAIAMSDDDQMISWIELKNAIANATTWMKSKPRSIALLGPNGISYVVAMLAAARAGKRLVPLPTFFSDAQLRKIAEDAKVEELVRLPGAVHGELPATCSAATFEIDRSVSFTCEPSQGFELVIYTSGSSGNPKGVVHSARQIEAVVRGLALASSATSADRYLSVLPLPMLLETICAVFLPIFVGAATHFAARLAERIGRGDARGLAQVVTAREPTATVLVPQVLRSMLFEFASAAIRPPESLRFVAVGGASVARPILDLADRLGVPVYEGYGLSECCSVVSLNRPEDRKIGSVGRPLDGIRVEICDGEIVVHGPTVMDRYLGGESVEGCWHTGDLGSLDVDGRLTVDGRMDSLIVTSFGRNINPEWVETAMATDPRIALAAVAGAGEPSLQALVVPSRFGEAWFADASRDDVQAMVTGLCADLPSYAIPSRVVVMTMRDAVAAMLVTPNGRIVRRRATDHLKRNQLSAAE